MTQISFEEMMKNFPSYEKQAKKEQKFKKYKTKQDNK